MNNTNMQSTVSLYVGGSKYEGWEEVKVTRALNAVAGTFSLTLSDRWPGQSTSRPIRRYESCVVKLDGETVITGYIDDVTPAYSDRSHSINITGRDKTGYLVDCSAIHSPGEWHNSGAIQIANELAAPFGIGVSVQHSVKPFKKFKLEVGETVFEALDRMCRMRSMLATSDVHGNLLLTRSGKGGNAGVVLQYGVNIKAAKCQLKGKDRYSEYIVKGQQPGIDTTAEGAAQIVAKAKDSQVPLYRPLLILAEDAADANTAAQRVAWERDTRKAKSSSVTITVQGWREQKGGALWLPNKLVPVKDPVLGIDATLLIESVELSRSSSGSLTTLTLVPPQAYAQDPTVKEEKVSAWS